MTLNCGNNQQKPNLNLMLHGATIYVLCIGESHANMKSGA